MGEPAKRGAKHVDRHGPRAIVVANDARVRRCATRALAAVGSSVTALGHEQLTRLSPRAEDYDLAVVDAIPGAHELEMTLTALGRGHEPPERVLLASRPTSRTAAKSLLAHGLNHMIGGVPETAHATARIRTRELMATTHKLLTGEIFGLERYLPSDARVHELELRHTEHRIDALAQLEAYLASIACRNLGVRSSILTVADELVMNAIFDAPRDGDGGAKYATTDRRASFAFEEHETVTVRFACDGEAVLLSVRDRFGALDRATVLRHLAADEPQRIALRAPPRGAGVGLLLIQRGISGLVFNLAPGEATEVIATFAVGQGPRVMRTSPQSLHIFYARAGAP